MRFDVVIRRLTLLAGVVTLLAAVLGTDRPARAESESLTVGAPHSLRAAFNEILPMFEREYGVPVHVVYTPSKTLLRQVEKGAAIDVFVAAGVEEVDYLYKKGRTLNGRPRVFAQTSLVLVMSAESTATSVSFRDALADHGTRIALGNPETSYLGEVSVRELTKLSPAYARRAHLTYAAHSEEILHLITTGKADVGLVYRANLMNSGDVRISDELPIGRNVSIQFGQAVVSNCRPSMRNAAEQFSDFLMQHRIQMLLVEHGFDLPRGGPASVQSVSK
jgi:molybdate transport system substrate-binding protein